MKAIKASTKAYETWLKARIGPDFVDAALDEKHDKMRSSAFDFLRATYWRWAETILTICPDLAGAPPVLAIGDIHIENFGTWRDAQGRLIWGVNDFDEAAIMPYTLDLVRLATSALLARDAGALSARDICAAIARGYAAGLVDPAPFVLEREHAWLRDAIMLDEKGRAKFWSKLEELEPESVPVRYEKALRAAMPVAKAPLQMAPRQAGTGSLGRPRVVACGLWKGGPVVREAKALVISGWSLRFTPDTTEILAGKIAKSRFRAPDPHYRVTDDIVVRRLSPNSRKIEVEDDAATLLSTEMLAAMGREIANCHAGDLARRSAVQADLRHRGEDWLRLAAKAAARAIAEEQRHFAS